MVLTIPGNLIYNNTLLALWQVMKVKVRSAEPAPLHNQTWSEKADASWASKPERIIFASHSLFEST